MENNKETDMTVTQITFSPKYIMQKNGGLNLNSNALYELGWDKGETWIDQYIDLKRNRLIIVEKDTPAEGFNSLFRSYLIGQLGFMTIDKETRLRLGWEFGDEFRQTLDKKLKGVIISKVKVEESENGESSNNE